MVSILFKLTLPAALLALPSALSAQASACDRAAGIFELSRGKAVEAARRYEQCVVALDPRAGRVASCEAAEVDVRAAQVDLKVGAAAVARVCRRG